MTATVDDIPVAHTPAGSDGAVVPPPVLAACREPVVAGAPDLRGWWRVVEVLVDDQPVAGHPALGQVQRIEQAIEVRRWRDGPDMRWQYVGFVGRLERGLPDTIQHLTPSEHRCGASSLRRRPSRLARRGRGISHLWGVRRPVWRGSAVGTSQFRFLSQM